MSCSVEGCERTGQTRRGMCDTHYRRSLRSGGDPGPAAIPPTRKYVACTVEGCGRAHRARGFCNAHLLRVRKTGDPGPPDLMKVVDRGGDVGYVGAHYRVYAAKGRASDFWCEHCDNRAGAWAYDHLDPDERSALRSGGALRYSLKVEHYFPLCGTCHAAFDAAERVAS